MKRAGGKSVQGYKAQVVASPEQVILAAQVAQSHNDADQLEPMVAHAVETLREAGIEEPIGIVLADGGYWNSQAISEGGPTGNRCARPSSSATTAGG
jgi:DDE family transposase